MGEQVIVLTDLTKKYGNFTAVDHISLSICKGEIFGLLGPNGAGKSTTILMMLGLTEPTSGKVEICGIDSTTNPIEVKRKIGYLPEDLGFYDDMTGLENLIYTALLNGFSRKEAEEKAKELMRRVGLAEQVNKKDRKVFPRYEATFGFSGCIDKESGNHYSGRADIRYRSCRNSGIYRIDS